MASLQLDGIPICNSGMFKKDFLITAKKCAIYIGEGIDIKHQKGTAVLGNINLENGQRVHILKIAYHLSASDQNDDDIGVVMVG